MSIEEVEVLCTPCNGTGKGMCISCGGSGKNLSGNTCASCHGSGLVKCKVCNGLGKAKQIRWFLDKNIKLKFRRETTG